MTTTSLSSLLKEYATRVETTDTLPSSEIRPVLFGLFGEVGSLLATAKKRVREKSVFAQYDADLVEEFGDILWYFAALCRRSNTHIESVVDGVDLRDTVEGTHSVNEGAALVALAGAAGAVVSIQDCAESDRTILCRFFRCFVVAATAMHVDLRQIAQRNERKVLGRFLPTGVAALPDFDSSFPQDEQLPRYFEIELLQRNGQARLRWNGVFIGDTLTDNVHDPDGYRFHDVFHLAYAAILHWSPVIRSLIRQKRKSDPTTDENEDGGRAIVVEEGVTAWIFSQAKVLDYFEDCAQVSFGLLKTVSQFLHEFEVRRCPLQLWERAILDGYSVFREIKRNDGGFVIGNRDDRSIAFRAR